MMGVCEGLVGWDCWGCCCVGFGGGVWVRFDCFAVLGSFDHGVWGGMV